MKKVSTGQNSYLGGICMYVAMKRSLSTGNRSCIKYGKERDIII